MIPLAFQAGDWAFITIALIVIGSVIGGMIKFYQAVKTLRQGPPKIDPEVLAEQEAEQQKLNEETSQTPNHEQNH